MIRKITALLTAIAALLALALSSAASETRGMTNFTKVYEYDGRFTDKTWAASYIIPAYEYGIIAGISPTEYGSSNTLTVAEALTIAAKIHAIYNYGSADVIDEITDGRLKTALWYEKFAEYLLIEEIINAEEYLDFWTGAMPSVPFFRVNMAMLWARLVDAEDLEPLRKYDNDFDDLEYPQELHESMTLMGIPLDAGFDEIILLYEAGIVNGANGKFMPLEPIYRDQAATIFMRLVDKSLRSQ